VRPGSNLAPTGLASGGRGRGLIVEVEVAGRALLEPQSVVLRRVLEELRGLLENVLLFL
jgi:hypothetical protein